MFDLSGKLALVTGAGQSVGAGVARTLAAAGASVAVNDLFEDRAAQTVEVIRAAGGTAYPAVFDVTDFGAAQQEVATLASTAGRPVDILVNNAGIPPTRQPKPFRQQSPQEWRPFIDLNLFGVLNCTKAVIDPMCDNGWGRVITISSGAALTGLNIGMSMYAAGKGGALSFMRHLAAEVAEFGVTVNALALGMMANVGSGSTDATRRLVRSIPLGRTGTGEDVGAACVWLAAEGSWVTGQTINVNGGNLMA